MHAYPGLDRLQAARKIMLPIGPLLYVGRRVRAVPHCPPRNNIVKRLTFEKLAQYAELCDALAVLFPDVIKKMENIKWTCGRRYWSQIVVGGD